MDLRIREIATRLYRDGRDAQDHGLISLSEAMNAWAVTLERLAFTAPEHLRATAQSFDDHPEHGMAVDARVAHRAFADLLSFIGIGDLVLNHLGRQYVRQTGWELRPNRGGFAAAVDAVDDASADPALRSAFRRLHGTLRSARNRLLAHPQPNHAVIAGWAADDTPQVDLFAVGDAEVTQAAVRRLNDRLDQPLAAQEVEEPRAFMETIVARAPMLTARELRALEETTRVVGVPRFSMGQAVDDVLVIASVLRPVT